MRLCEDCGQEIPKKRLKALPGAVRCVVCEEARHLAPPRFEELPPTVRCEMGDMDITEVGWTRGSA
jgi:Prokaryotic dksA/traR C4-type zinc finger